MGTNTLVRELDVPDVHLGDARRLEVVVYGLPLHGGAQLVVDTTLVSALHCDGRPRRGAADRDGVALTVARKTKERRYPEFVGVRARARLVVLAVEVGGRFSPETSGFLTSLAKARARTETALMRKRAEQAWRLRWCGIFGCAAAKAFAASLLKLHGAVGVDGMTPATHEVEGDFCYAPQAWRGCVGLRALGKWPLSSVLPLGVPLHPFELRVVGRCRLHAARTPL